MNVNLSHRTVIRELGSGGFGQTTLYEDDRNHRFVLKTFAPQGSNDSPKALAMFKAECDRLREVGDHPQIPSYLGFEEKDGSYAIAQQYIPGRSLRQHLDEEGQYTPTQALKLLEEVLTPLEHLHRNKVIHRDIKPDNIIISLESSLPVIVDFGAAKLVSETVLAQTGTVIGTANYAAPEQLAGQTCFQSDLFSLGLTIIELLTGIQPFEQVDLHTGESIWFASSNGISSRFERILNKMTARFLRDRYQSIEEIRDAIYSLRQFTDQQIREKEASAEKRRSRRRFLFRKVVPSVAALGLLGCGAFGVWNIIQEPVTQFVMETGEKISPKPNPEKELLNPEPSVTNLFGVAIFLVNALGFLGVLFGIVKMLSAISKDDEDVSSQISFVLAPIILLIAINTMGKFLIGDVVLQTSSPVPERSDDCIPLNPVDPLDPINQLGC